MVVVSVEEEWYMYLVDCSIDEVDEVDARSSYIDHTGLVSR